MTRPRFGYGEWFLGCGTLLAILLGVVVDQQADDTRAARGAARRAKAAGDVRVLAARGGGRSGAAAVPNDPWGNAYVLRHSDRHPGFEVRSAGPDGRLDTADDISSARR